MDSRIAHPHGHNYDDHDPHNAAPHPAVAPQGGDEHAHERKSVIKKVKAKAKKIKDTLKKHGHHDHEHDHDYQRAGHHIPDDHDLDEEDDDDEEIIEDPEVHGESEERYDTKINEPITVSHSPGVYGIKAPDPTGTGDKVVGITPILQSFVKMNVHDEPDPKSAGVADHDLPILTYDQFTKLPSTGSHDQFSPEPVPQEAKAIRDKPQLPKSFETTKQQNHPHEVYGKPSNQSSYSEKISSATSAVADKAISASNAAASKLVYGEKVHGTSNESECGVKGQDKGVSVKDYVLEKLRPGEEDRALSELISDALHKQRMEEPGKEKDMRPVGKVTESKEVARRLGTRDESHGERTQKGVVDKLKGTVIGSWLGLGGESKSQVPQQPHGE
ncbi:low-temperature-induced 65 kDa protein-like isoform X2 [Corylus avellana]|uniref:low-temperature-induced 65 kDa protein-like isoform X2 n=1 Tax=Corylus avellana TaxID=13451 RepID=UPI00286C9374|nr:low-temperature-induced 65 kDa protein-like isoform X2 [Corylus avellana]